MKKLMTGFILLSFMCTVVYSAGNNPFFKEFDTPFDVPPFDKIETSHYFPAFEEAMKRHNQEIDAIVNNSEPPTFHNTIEALDKSGAMLAIVDNIFFSMNSAMTNEPMQEIAKSIAPVLSKHRDNIMLNERLFSRIKTVYDMRPSLDLKEEQNTLLENYYRDFVRGGANLDDNSKKQFKTINEELSVLKLKFGENILNENNRFELLIDKIDDLSGLKQSDINAAAQAAAERGYKNKWVFTLHKPSMIPFLTYSTKRDLREKIYKGYINRGDHNDDLDNKTVLTKITSLRLKRAHLLGYGTHADYVLEENMAKTPERVYTLLEQLWKPALRRAKSESAEMQTLIDREGGGFKLEPWDWWYYAEKLRKMKYDLDDEMLRPYFVLENVRTGAFLLAEKLYGLTFRERLDCPKYHEDVKVFEVLNEDGSHLGIFYTDYFPRESKRGGAWMGAFRKEYIDDGQRITPVVFNVGNFSKPTSDKPALLSMDETLTLFHEFGHALHGLLSECTYRSLSGTAVATDFVELPSQVMENWALEPEMLRIYAKHYKTGKPMPAALIEKIKNSRLFNQGFATVEYLAACFLDMDWHTIKNADDLDPVRFEQRSLQRIGLIPEIISRYRSPYFRHIFSGGYSAGYYSYVWAEVLDADAFHAFKETNIFDKKTADLFRENVLAKGASCKPMTLYKRFRGAEPSIEPLLKRRGLNN